MTIPTSVKYSSERKHEGAYEDSRAAQPRAWSLISYPRRKCDHIFSRQALRMAKGI